MNRRTGGSGAAAGEGTMARASADGVGLREDLGERERRGVPARRSAETSAGEMGGSGVRTRVKVPSVCVLAEAKRGPGS
eukprot:5431272-Lingulodinium_polyedra.AAC.1